MLLRRTQQNPQYRTFSKVVVHGVFYAVSNSSFVTPTRPPSRTVYSPLVGWLTQYTNVCRVYYTKNQLLMTMTFPFSPQQSTPNRSISFHTPSRHRHNNVRAKCAKQISQHPKIVPQAEQRGAASALFQNDAGTCAFMPSTVPIPLLFMSGLYVFAQHCHYNLRSRRHCLPKTPISPIPPS